MQPYNIERNNLDYILTDLLPVEITELFSLNNFYSYLLENHTQLENVISQVKKTKSENKKIMFENGWATAPLKFNILKGNDSQREMSLMQPLSALNVYLFLECYQKELLISLKENSIFSLRYHGKNNDLYYKKNLSKVTEYYQTISKKINKGVLQQTGAFFKIHKFNSLSSFTDSRIWQELNFKYCNFARMDYRSCFGSIYTHVYKWVLQKNVVDSKDAKNANLYVTIDRILQNINAKSSNGVIVGPEFSRMIVEILLQQVDVEVKTRLSKAGLEKDIDYDIFRYVDDIFIFANTSNNVDCIISTITDVAQKYLLRHNELKLFKASTPFTLNHWISRTRELAEKLSNLFYDSKEVDSSKEVDLSKEVDSSKEVDPPKEVDPSKEVDLSKEKNKHLIKGDYFAIQKIKNDFNAIVCDFPDNQRTIVSFSLSTLLNNISKKKDGLKLFKTGSENKAFHILELALYIFAFCPCFEHTQRIISMIVYFDDELKFLENESHRLKLQKTFDNYAFVFLRGNLNDLCNLFVLFDEYKLIIPSNYEDKIFNRIQEMENPLLLANYLLYSRHYEPYHASIVKEIEKQIKRSINHITKGEEMLQKEFWYIIIFNNCPFLSSNLKTEVQEIIDRVKFTKPTHPSEILSNMICDFLSSGKKDLFFSWGVHKFSISKQIAFRTYQRSLFRDYRKNSSMLYGSLD